MQHRRVVRSIGSLLPALLLAGFLLSAEAAADTVYGINGNQLGARIFRFDSANPSATTALTITGFASGDYWKALEFRPSDGVLYAVAGNSNTLWRIDLAAGTTSLVLTHAGLASGSSNEFGMSWNPVTDELRLVLETDTNRRVPGSLVTVISDTNLSYAPGDPNFGSNPRVPALAYTHKTLGAPAASTTLYGIDIDLDILVRIGSPGGSPTSPNSGQVFTVGALGVDVNSILGFDIIGTTAYATTQLNRFFSIDLTTGAATFLGTIGVPPGVPSTFNTRDIAVVPPSSPVPEPASLCLSALAMMAAFARHRRRRGPARAGNGWRRG